MNKNVPCFYIQLDPYLRQWTIFQNGGTEPVDFPKGSIERDLIVMNTGKLPANEAPDIARPGLTAVRIHNERGKNQSYYTHIPKKIKDQLKKMLRRRFDCQLMMFMLDGRNSEKLMADALAEWMTANGIEFDDKNYNAVAKRFQRRRKFYGLKNKKSKKNR